MPGVVPKDFEKVSSLNSEVGVEIKTTHPYYTPGSTVQGTIVLRVRRRIEHCGMHIKCSGILAAHRDPKFDERPLVNTEDQDEVRIPPGVWDAGMVEIPFEFLLTKDVLQTCVIPESLDRNAAVVLHYISVAVIFSSAMDLHATKEFVVRRVCSPMPAPLGVSLMHSIEKSMFSSMKRVFVTISIDKDVFQAGEDIPVKVRMHCIGFSKHTHSVNLILERKLAFHFQGVDDSQLDRIASSENLFFQAGFPGERTANIKIPANAPPSIKAVIFTCSYQLVAKVTPSKSTKPFDTKLNVRIGFEH
jgi:hypothetical protein